MHGAKAYTTIDPCPPPPPTHSHPSPGDEQNLIVSKQGRLIERTPPKMSE